MAPEHRERTAFTAGPLGLYEYLRMPFGLTNAPARFQRLMERVLEGLTFKKCLIYLDDIVVYGCTPEEHMDNLHEVLDRLKQAGLKLKPSKCSFLQRKLRYLGHIVSAEGIASDPSLTSTVKVWPEPKDVTMLRQFLGFGGYFRRFIKDFSKLTAPLNKLLVGHHCGKKVGKSNAKKLSSSPTPWEWAAEQQTAFETLKDKLLSPPILAYPNYKQPFLLQVDASGLRTRCSA